MAFNTCFSDLPTEVIAHIFLQGTISQQATKPYGRPYPFLVAQVCSTWRTIALSSPTLWTVIVVPIFYQPAGLLCLTATNSLIERSARLPISVILDARFSWRKAGDNTGMVSPGFMQMMLQCVVESAGDRLRQLDICVPYYSALGPKDYSLLDSASNLEQLTVVSASMFPSVESISSAFFDRSDLWNDISLPRLRKFRWSNPSVPMLVNLTTFSATSLSMAYEDVFTFFRGSPHLSHLILDDLRPIVGGVPQPLPDQRIEVPSLTHVAIKCYREMGPQNAHIFTFLRIDHLFYLELDGTMSVTQLFGSSIPQIADSLRELMIANYSNLSLDNKVDGKRDIEAIQSFNGLNHLYLLHAPSQLLKPSLKQPQPRQNLSLRRSGSISRLRSELTRQPGINFVLAEHDRLRLKGPNGIALSDSESATQLALWPHLRHITFDSLLALDISNLCNWIKDHPTLAVLNLSGMALRHVKGSVQRRGDVVYPRGWKPYTPIVDDEGTEALQDVKDWISARVQLRVMTEKCCGMLYNRVFNALGDELP